MDRKLVGSIGVDIIESTIWSFIRTKPDKWPILDWTNRTDWLCSVFKTMSFTLGISKIVKRSGGGEKPPGWGEAGKMMIIDLNNDNNDWCVSNSNLNCFPPQIELREALILSSYLNLSYIVSDTANVELLPSRFSRFQSYDHSNSKPHLEYICVCVCMCTYHASALYTF